MTVECNKDFPKTNNAVDIWAYMLDKAEPGATIKMSEHVYKIHELVHHPAYARAILKGVNFTFFTSPRTPEEAKMLEEIVAIKTDPFGNDVFAKNMEEAMAMHSLAWNLHDAYEKNGVDGLAAYFLKNTTNDDKPITEEQAKIIAKDAEDFIKGFKQEPEEIKNKLTYIERMGSFLENIKRYLR